MLNRTHYKRLGNDNKYSLTQTLHWYSQEIFLSDTVGLTEPNVSLGRPGVLFIEGERIEYFLLFTDRVGQLRRGTLGTGVKNNYEIGTEVFDQSAFQTVPYKDETITEISTSDGSSNILLSWMPQSVNEFEVFVAGRRLRKNSIRSYNATLGMDSPEADVILPAEFSLSMNVSNITRASPAVITTSTNHIYPNSTKITFAGIGGMVELNSGTYYTKYIGPNSFEIYVDAALTIPVNTSTLATFIVGTATVTSVDVPILTLITAPPVNTKIIVVRRVGKLWNPDTALSQAENDIARFLRAKEVSLPQ
jgi:hypothetical protein